MDLPELNERVPMASAEREQTLVYRASIKVRTRSHAVRRAIGVVQLNARDLFENGAGGVSEAARLPHLEALPQYEGDKAHRMWASTRSTRAHLELILLDAKRRFGLMCHRAVNSPQCGHRKFLSCSVSGGRATQT